MATRHKRGGSVQTMLLRMASILALWLGFAATAPAHEMSLAELDMRELSKGDFIWSWGASSTARPLSADLTAVWPKGCTANDQSLHCESPGLVGSFSVDGVGKKYSAVMLRVHWLDGQTRVYTLTAAQPSIYLHGGAEDTRPWTEVASAYTVLGIEHILTGVDHLLFVFSLLFLVGFQRKLVTTITAFTAAHSLTLALSALGLLTLRSPPVEATIALSIVLVAGEALRQGEGDSLARRWPALLAFVFGLVHGLGFAGALKEIGLPQHHLVAALFTFNVGVELGQLATVGAAFLLTRLLSRYSWFVRSRTLALYLIGVTGAFWSVQRLAAIVM